MHTEHVYLMLWAVVQYEYYYEGNEIDTNLDECEYPKKHTITSRR